jgi:hypothetical protein
MLSGAIGPAFAGILISLLVVNGGQETNLQGIGVAFLINALTFWLGISLFAAIRTSAKPAVDPEREGSLFASLPEIGAFIRNDVRLIYMLVLMLTLGLFLEGTIRVGFALLADSHLTGNVQDLGNMTSAFGLGVLIGMISRRLLPKPDDSIAGLITLSLFSAVPVGLILLGLIRSVVPILIVILVMGLAVGYILIYLLTWLQLRTPRRLLGKVMAAVFFTTTGLSPLSQLIMGYLLDINLTWTFIGVGSLIFIILIIIATNRKMWSFEFEEAAATPIPPQMPSSP